MIILVVFPGFCLDQKANEIRPSCLNNPTVLYPIKQTVINPYLHARDETKAHDFLLLFKLGNGRLLNAPANIFLALNTVKKPTAIAKSSYNFPTLLNSVFAHSCSLSNLPDTGHSYRIFYWRKVREDFIILLFFISVFSHKKLLNPCSDT